jgi:hypothetical protein
MTEQRSLVMLRWAWFALAVVALLVLARMTRYAPEGDGYFWDRWRHRECEAVDGRLDCSAVEDRSVQTARVTPGPSRPVRPARVPRGSA